MSSSCIGGENKVMQVDVVESVIQKHMENLVTPTSEGTTGHQCIFPLPAINNERNPFMIISTTIHKILIQIPIHHDHSIRKNHFSP